MLRASRQLTNFSIMEALRNAAKSVAKEFNEPSMAQRYSLWGDCIFNEGISIVDQAKFENYTKLIKSDIESLRKQAHILRN